MNDSLSEILAPEHILISDALRYAFASDAGPYWLLPRAVLQPRTELEIQRIFQLAKDQSVPVVFRAGGTSLSGQSVTDGWLVDISRYWRKIEVLNEGMQVSVQGGAIGGLVNATLYPYGRKIGPDPSSIMSAMMGGILSNNSSGMCCGVSANAYHTVSSIRFILPDGSIWDTSLEGEHERFDVEQAEIATGLSKLRQQVLNSPELSNKIREKYRQKNTVGYSLNALVDYSSPLDILAHFLIGGEGTLAFISEAVLNTLVELPYKATALAFFSDVTSACDSIPLLIEAGCAAVELMDYASLASIQNLDGVQPDLKDMLRLYPTLTSVLFEFHAESDYEIDSQIAGFDSAIGLKLPTIRPVVFTCDKKEQAKIWKLRKGMYPAVAAVRARGETAILEDIAVPVEKLGPAILDLQALFRKHEYQNGIIFGHAKDGNLHFVITQSLNESKDVERYSRFISDMVELVVHRYNGALKAEHGTGRNMAPFVETEWGPEAMEVMSQLKNLVDPHGILNPDVILSKNKNVHLCNLKKLPVVEEVVDKCIECGACEPRCPSRDLTLTPRQRIVLRRSIISLRNAGDGKTASRIEREYNYQGKDTCATDGLCAVDCPVNINTGELIKQLRIQDRNGTSRFIASALSNNFAVAERMVQWGIWLGTVANQLFSRNAMKAVTKGLAKVVPQFPQWHDSLRTERVPYSKQLNDLSIVKSQIEFVYMPACMSRMMGGTADALLRVCSKAGIVIHLPKTAMGSCCGQAFSSKGFLDTAVIKQTEWINRCWEVSNQGRIPIVTDLGSCTAFAQKGLVGLAPEAKDRLQRLSILDSIDLAHDFVLPKLQIVRKLPVIAVHSVCSNQKTKLGEKLEEIANSCASTVINPHEGKCCGMGGDRGFAIPELVLASTAAVAGVMEEAGCDHGYTSARSCAIALETSSGVKWDSVFHLLNAVIE